MSIRSQSTRHSLLLVGLATVVACGDNHATHDAPVGDGAPGGCWPDDVSTFVPTGTITIGAGNDVYMPMPDPLPLFYGQQGGFGLYGNARMTGLDPGNPSNILDPKNPRTRFTVTFADSGQLIGNKPCSARIPYLPTSDGAFELEFGVTVEYFTCFPDSAVFDRQIHIFLEILDDKGGYATDERTVTAIKPPGWSEPDAGVVDPDAGVTVCPPAGP